MNLSENIQKQRKTHGLSQEKLADKCEVSRQSVAKWENGDSVPSIDKLILLANLFETSLDELVGRVVLDDFDRFAAFVTKFIPSDIRFGDDDDISAVVYRYIVFMRKMNLSDKDILDGLQEIFLAGEDENDEN